MDFTCGKVGLSHGGLNFLYFVADPAQPLDSNLRATLVRITSTKTFGASDANGLFVASAVWGGGHFHLFCKKLSINTWGTKMPSEEDVSQIFEKLKVSPGVGLFSDGSATICVGKSEFEPCSPND